MQLKFIAAALLMAFGLAHGEPAKPAGDTGKSAARRTAQAHAASQAANEDALGRSVFQALIGEFALQRGDVKLGLEAWSDLAQRTRDPQALARATEIATLTQQYDLALELGKLWLAVEPDSAKAAQANASLLVMANRLDELAPQLTRLLEQEPGNIANNLLQLNRLLARMSDKAGVQKLVDRLALPYGQYPEAHFAMAQAAFNANDNLRALNETEKALLLRPDWENAALLRAQIESRQSMQSAIDSLTRFVGQHEHADEARLTLARLLIGEKNYNEARGHYEQLLKDKPDAPEVLYPAAMLALQQGDATSGRRHLERLLQTDFPDRATLHFFLGQLDEEQKQPEAALEHYRQVGHGEQFVVARTRAAQILMQQGKPEEARELLRSPGSKPAERAQLQMTEAQMLREAGHLEEAAAVLENALARQPDNPDLLYESALLAERRGKPELLETRLKHLIALKPEHAHALNALGYSYADRNIRLDEAEKLIAKALVLAPEDPFILDSMGWVRFRQGKLPEALKTLEYAYGLKADPEIAAHLGEVLWALGRKDDARRLLKEAASKNPDNEVLSGTIKKFLP